MPEVKATFTGFNYLEATVVKEIMHNVLTLLATPAGTCAGDRSYGIDQSLVDAPRPVVENQLALEVTDKLEIYEPRVEVMDVEFSSLQDGQIKAVFHLGPNEEYIEAAEEDDEETYEEEAQDY